MPLYPETVDINDEHRRVISVPAGEPLAEDDTVRFGMTFKSIKIKKLSTQIAEQIRSAILAGEYTPGDKLPSERELAEIFGVSRPSVREALNMLASAGLIASHQGGGTVVLSLLESADINPFSELIHIEKERALDVIEVRKGP